MATNIQKTPVSFLIPSYNGKNLLKKYLPSIFNACRSNDQVLIIDDESNDDTVKWLVQTFRLKSILHAPHSFLSEKRYFPNPKTHPHHLFEAKLRFGKKVVKLTLINSNKNLRFAGAVNLGALYAENNYLFLINNDVKLTPNVLDPLLNHFSDRQVFAVGCLEFEVDEHGVQSGKNKLWFDKGLFMHSRASDMLTGDTAWVSGGSGLFDKNKFFNLGGFDQLFYPAYWEDVDLSFQARKKGYRVLFEQRAIVYHIHETSNKAVFGDHGINNMSFSNQLKFTKKNASFLQKILYYLYLPYWLFKRRNS